MDYTKRPTFDQILENEFFTRNLIPKFLPLSILAVPPNSCYIKQFESRGRSKQKDESIIRASSQEHAPTSNTPSPTNERPRSRDPQKPLHIENKILPFSSAYLKSQPLGPEIWVKT